MTESKNVLVVGGAGYIGSHMVKYLSERGSTVTVFDNLSTGYRDAVLNAELIVGDLANINQVKQVLLDKKINAVMHFASSIQVAESVRDPGLYYENNVANTLNLVNAMVACNVKKIIFSSTAAIYGDPKYTPIDEKHPKAPINPYGQSKWIVEKILRDFDSAYGLKSICLRYFNAAGSDPNAELGERHEPETHLIPLVLQVANKRRKHICIYGDDYETADGSCVRDYIHIVDLCSAHHLALQYLDSYDQSEQFNLGNGNGFSVKQVIAQARKVTQQQIKTRLVERRQGDPAVLVAESSRAKKVLGWRPIYPGLHEIIEHAWRWECSFFSQQVCA